MFLGKEGRPSETALNLSSLCKSMVIMLTEHVKALNDVCLQQLPCAGQAAGVCSRSWMRHGGSLQ